MRTYPGRRRNSHIAVTNGAWAVSSWSRSTRGVHMSSTTRIPKAEISGPYGYVLKRVSRKLLGAVPESVEVTWHNRPVLSTILGIGRKADKWKELDPNLKSFAHMAVASLVGCSWCLDFGYFHA